jgi:hypothetical protein
MHYFRRLPPLLRMISLLSLLLWLTALVLILEGLPIIPTSFPRVPVDAHRAGDIGMILLILSFACSFVVNNYTLRFRRPGRQAYPLDTWLSQMRWWLLLGALPLCALTVAILLPRTPLFDLMLFLPTVLAMLVLGAAWVYAADKWQALS